MTERREFFNYGLGFLVGVSISCMTIPAKDPIAPWWFFLGTTLVIFFGGELLERHIFPGNKGEK